MSRFVRSTCAVGGFVLALLAACLGGCMGGGGVAGEGNNSGSTSGRASDAQREYPLDTLARSQVSINGHVFNVWLAQDFDDSRPGIVSEGLMYVPTEEIADDEGMLFVFSDERERSFWMRNTIAPLDIAFARFNGEIVKIWQMEPLTLRSHYSIEPAMFALEVKQGTFAALGIAEGDQLVISDDVFKTTP